MLARRWCVLCWAYGVLVAGVAVSLATLGFIQLPLALVSLFGGEGSLEPGWRSPKEQLVLVAIGVVQAVFLFGGGRIWKKARRRTIWRLLLPTLIATLAVGILLSGIVLASLDLLSFWGFTPMPGSESDHLWWWGVPVMLAVFVVLTRSVSSLDQAPALFRLASVVLALSFIEITLAVTAELTVPPYLTGMFSWITGSWVGLSAAIPISICVVGIMLVLLRFRAQDLPVNPWGVPRASPGGPYIASARSMTSLLLVILYFGFTQATSHGDRLTTLIDARNAFARDVVLDLAGKAGFGDWAANHEGGGDGLDRDEEALRWLKEHLPNNASFVEWAETVSALADRVRMPGIFDGGPSGIVFGVSVVEHLEKRRWSTRLVASPNELSTGQPDNTRRVAIRVGLEIREDDDYATLFPRLENELIGKEVALPASGFTFRVGDVVWVASGLALVLLVLIRDRLRKALADPALGAGEPWLILDASGGVSGILANLWLTALAVAPLFVGVHAMRMAALTIRAEGTMVSVARDMLSFVALFCAAMLSTWIALTVISDLLLLRRLQRAAFDVEAPAPRSAGR